MSHPTDQELEFVLRAIEDAREAGVAEQEIDAVLASAAAEPHDELWEPILSGRLHNMATRARLAEGRG